ncbi:MAG TPA: SUF system NifU family Fe-S cluster assembly protein [Tichowtungia sp.]|nr:SUF system NifU family Fe-S cluster assembly protein [Tichowtungia sp.]
MNISDDLYQDTILEYNREPRNFRTLENATHVAHGLNPLCGDDYHVYLRVEDGVIQEAAFDGHGCAISKASASMMTLELKGKTIEEAKSLFSNFHELLSGSGEIDVGKLNVFSGVWKFPERVKCASLAWHAMDSALTGGETTSTE